MPSEELLSKHTVSASPNNRFFVEMLTRDISLEDSILDLLDNCIDGVLRSLVGQEIDRQKPFRGFRAVLSINEDEFRIEDNCGGISRELAVESAFQMGRQVTRNEELPTIGMYGIGMKRAIFKLGSSCVVASTRPDDAFEVEISPDWMRDEDIWELPIRSVPRSRTENGTSITVRELRQDIRTKFCVESTFVDELKKTIAQFYMIIIDKGFEVVINDDVIAPSVFMLLSAPESDLSTGARSMSPYYLEKTVDDVQVKIWAGMYRGIPDEDEMEKEYVARASKDDAGWTIVCNDRVIVYRDKTRLTGWGDGVVPNYHGQFIGFNGIVIMSAPSPEKLPLTTTKRGIDGSSLVFLETKQYMQEATKYFTTMTNKWKGQSNAREVLYKGASAVTLSQLEIMSAMLPTRENKQGWSRFVPKLPDPPKSAFVRIAFQKHQDEIKEVALFLFEDEAVAASEVGRFAFDDCLKRARG